MHTLHAILVDLRNVLTKNPDDDRIRAYAEEMTEGYCEEVFDWRETETAGRWSEIYENNVLRGTEQKKEIIEAIENAKLMQDEHLEYCMKTLYEIAGTTDLNELLKSTEKEKFRYYLTEAADVIAATIATIQTSVSKGKKVTLVGFGSFEARKRKARTGRNPQTGATIKIAAKTVPAFSAGKKFKELVK